VDPIDCWYDLDGERRYDGRRLGPTLCEIGVKYVSPLEAEDLLVRLLWFLRGDIRGKPETQTPESGGTEVFIGWGTLGACSSGSMTSTTWGRRPFRRDGRMLWVSECSECMEKNLRIDERAERDCAIAGLGSVGGSSFILMCP
jgi:hypothetical protein